MVLCFMVICLQDSGDLKNRIRVIDLYSQGAYRVKQGQCYKVKGHLVLGYLKNGFRVQCHKFIGVLLNCIRYGHDIVAFLRPYDSPVDTVLRIRRSHGIPLKTIQRSFISIFNFYMVVKCEYICEKQVFTFWGSHFSHIWLSDAPILT